MLISGVFSSKIVGICIELGYKEVGTIWYKDPTFSMHILNDDKGAHDIAILSKVHLSIEVFMQHPPSQLEFFDGPINEEAMDVVNL